MTIIMIIGRDFVLYYQSENLLMGHYDSQFNQRVIGIYCSFVFGWSYTPINENEIK